MVPSCAEGGVLGVLCGTIGSLQANEAIELIEYEEFCGTVSDEAQQAAAGSTITAPQLKELLDRGERLALIDVREPAEWQINRIPGATLIPLGELPHRLAELPQTEPVVLYCKSGVRSAEALALVKQSGLANARHLGGGITSYGRTVDPDMPQY